MAKDVFQLDRIHAPAQRPGRERMAEQVRVDTLPDDGHLCQRANHLGGARTAKPLETAGRASSGCEEEVVSGRMVMSRRTDVEL